MEEWKEYKLGDIANFTTGKLNSNAAVENGQYPFFTCSPQTFRIDTYAFDQDAILLAGNNAEGNFNIKRYSGKFNAYQRTYVISEKNTNEVDLSYLFYALKLCLNDFKHISQGTATKFLTAQILNSFPINLPSLPTQQKIAAILSSLDDKIELNNKINENLEQQAQALFKSWFIDFEPFGGKMPDGWKVGKLSEIAEITMGQSPDGKSYNEDGIGTVFYQGRAEFGTRFPTRRLFTTEPKRMAKKFDTLMSVRAPVGDTNIANEDCCIGRGLAAIHSKDNHQSFVHYTVLSLRTQLDIFNGEGTVFGCINRDALNNMEIVIPAKNDLDKFEQIVASMDADIFNRSEENSRLINIRDSLLPKLMNGEIESQYFCYKKNTIKFF